MNADEMNEPEDIAPGPNDQELERAVSAFVAEQENGTAPTIEQFVASYPQIADRLRACLDGLAVANAAAQNLTSSLTRLPQRLGEFEITGELGRGGMGEVYRANQVSLNRPVALKVLPPNWGWTPNGRKRFHREAQAAARLHHTNIVAVYAEGEQHGICYYAMELIDGPTLEQVIRDLRVTSESDDRTRTDATSDSSRIGKSSRERFDIIANWIASLADALAYAHEQGVIHRDVKPSNVMVGADGRVRLTDFGLARITTEPGMTVTGELLGTPRYMSPEQVSSRQSDVDTRTDVYSLGATLYELLTFRPPFLGETRDQVISQLLSKEPKRPRQIDLAIPVDLETICLKAVEKDPSRRYQSVTDLADDLRCYINRYAISAKRTGPIGRIAKWSRRHPAIAILSAGLVAMAIAIACLAWSNFGNAERVATEQKYRAMDQAMADAMAGNTANAESAVRQAELLGAERGWVRMVEGQIALSRGDTKLAFEHLDQAVKLMPDSVSALALRGRLQIYNDSYQFGGATHKKLQTMTPETTEDFIFLGYFYSVYAPEEGIVALDRAIEQRDSSVARMIRADALNNAIQLGDASLIDRAVKDAEAAYGMLEANQLALAKCIEAHTVAANAFHIAGDEEQRQEHLARGEELVRTVPNDASDDVNDQLLFHAACFWDRKGDRDQALIAWRRAADSGWIRSVKHCVVELYRQGWYEEALALCDRSRDQAIGTNLIPMWMLLHAELGNFDEVEEQASLIQPENMYKILMAQIVLGNERTDAITSERESPNEGFGKTLYEINHGIQGASILPELTEVQRPEAQFHLAHRLLGERAPDRVEAARHFRAMEAAGTYYFHEYRWARAFRERIESDPIWPTSIRASALNEER